MAEGGYDLEMDDPNQPLLPQTTDRTAEVTFGNHTFDNNTQFNTGNNSNLSSDPSFSTQIRPPADVSLVRQELTYNGNEDKLKNALEGTGWTYTNTGLTKLSPKIITEGNKFILHTRTMGR